MKKLLAIPLLLTLTSCANLSGGSVVSDIVSACRTYETVAAVLKLGSALHPGYGAIVTSTTAQVDPICAMVLAGQAAPAGVTAQWVSERTVQLEETR